MVWRYGEILKSMYSSVAGVSATPSAPSNSEVVKRLDVVEQLLRDILSRLDGREREEFVSRILSEIKWNREYIDRLSQQVKELRQDISSVQSELESCSVPDMESLFSELKAHIDERISFIESKLSELSSSIQYSGFKPIQSVGDQVVGPSLRIPHRGLVRKRSKGV